VLAAVCRQTIVPVPDSSPGINEALLHQQNVPAGADRIRSEPPAIHREVAPGIHASRRR